MNEIAMQTSTKHFMVVVDHSHMFMSIRRKTGSFWKNKKLKGHLELDTNDYS